MLALLRHVPAAMAHVQDGGWIATCSRAANYTEKQSASSATVAGTDRARYLKAFDMYILASDPHIETRALEPGVTLVPLAQLLREADLVTLHVNLCEETHGFFGREQFAAMKKGAWFINTFSRRNWWMKTHF